VEGLSIGYRVGDGYYNGDVHYLTDVDLVEISIVTFPACAEAVVNRVKAVDFQNAACVVALKNISRKLNNFMKGIM
jgi:phage head maturation protease